MDSLSLRRKKFKENLTMRTLYGELTKKNNTPKKYSEDCLLRREIHNYILTLSGKTREEALQELYRKFKDEKYSKYYQYFETWLKYEHRGEER